MTKPLAGTGSPFTEEELIAMVLEDEPRKETLCKFCGKGGLQWVQYKYNGATRWILLGLFEGHLVKHNCPEGKAHADSALSSAFKKFK